MTWVVVQGDDVRRLECATYEEAEQVADDFDERAGVTALPIRIERTHPVNLNADWFQRRPENGGTWSVRLRFSYKGEACELLLHTDAIHLATAHDCAELEAVLDAIERGELDDA